MITGTIGNDTLTGTNGDDVLSGLDGDDLLIGGLSNDALDGGDGTDTLMGGAGNDVLSGGSGNDVLVGGADNDSLTGGGGIDIAIFSGSFTDYQIVDLGNGSLQVTDLRAGSPDGIDVVTDIDHIRFLDDDTLPSSIVQISNPLLVGSSEQIVATAAGAQYANVATMQDGKHLHIWNEGTTVKAQIVGADGQPTSSVLSLGTASGKVSVALLPNGGFVTVRIAGTTLSVDRYDSDGVADGSPQTVSGISPYAGAGASNGLGSYNYRASIAVLQDGSSVVAWNSYGGDGTNDGIRAQRYDALGAPIGSSFQVNTVTSDYQILPIVTTLSNGNYIITWQSGAIASQYDVKAQIYAANGVKIGTEIALANISGSNEGTVSVSALSNGGFVAAWFSLETVNGSAQDIYAGVFDAAGQPVGSNFRVNTAVADYQWNPAITVLTDGTFVVTWDNASTGEYNISGQRFSASGDKIGEEFTVNTGIANGQNLSSIAADMDGGFTVSWQSSEGTIRSRSFDSIGIGNLNNAPTDLADADAAANTVAENAAAGTLVGITALAIDPGAGDNLTYSLSDDAGGRFQIDDATGVISVADGGLLDYETATSHSITVVATDADGLTTSQAFAVAVTNVNETPTTPTDTDTTANTVAENAAMGTVVGITALATDPDAGDTPTYSLSDDAGGRFQIDAATGVISVADGGLLDHEIATSHSITVVATDADGLTTSQAFAVAVTNVNETPTTPTDTDTTANTVAENAATGTVVDITALASDPDEGDTLAYSLSDDAGGRFQIDAATGVISVADGGLLDHETAASHSVTVVATDAGGLTTSQEFAIAVTDVNEAPTALTDSDTATNTVAENATTGTVVGVTALATDPDAGDSLTYSLSDDAGGRFQIDAATGVISVADGGLLDHETAISHSVTVVATDANGLTTSQAFAIAVTNVNEAPTDILLSNTSVVENMAGQVIGTLSTSDPDTGDSHTYAISDNRFEIVGGQLKLKQYETLDHGNEPIVTVTVTSTDAGGLSIEEDFAITVNKGNNTVVTTGGSLRPVAVTGSVGGDYSTVTTLSDGRQLVTWLSGGTTKGRFYNAAGQALGAEFSLGASLGVASVGAFADGGFVLARISVANTLSLQRYDAAGQAVGSAWTRSVSLSATPVVFDFLPNNRVSVTVLSDGGYVVVWDSTGVDPSGHGIAGQRFDSAGNAVGTAFRLNTVSVDEQLMPDVVALSTGGFVAVWDSTEGGIREVRGHVYDGQGQPVGGGDFLVTLAAGHQYGAQIAALADGGFVVVWQSYLQDGGAEGIYGQRYDSSGSAVGGEFRANTVTAGAQHHAQVTGLADGGYVVVWLGASGGVFGQIYDATGAKLGTEFQANTTATASYINSTIDALPDGGFTISWTSANGNILTRTYSTQAEETDIDDVLVGGSGNDVLDGKGGNDTLIGGLGNDTLIGGSGNDTAVFAGRAEDYQVTDLGNGQVQVTDLRGTGNEGTDTLSSVEELRFLGALPPVTPSDPEAITGLTGGQRSGVVTLLDGRQLVTWRSGTTGKARFLDASGQAVGGELDLGGSIGYVAVDALADGGFVTARLASAGQLSVQRYDSTGVAIGTAWTRSVVVRDSTDYWGTNNNRVSVTVLSDASYVVVWDSTGVDGSLTGVAGQRFDADGAALGSVFQINTVSSGNQYAPDVIALSNGGFVVSWTDSSSGNEDIRFRIYDAQSQPVGSSDAIVNNASATYQETSAITALSGGGFVVVWVGYQGSGPYNWTVYSRYYDASGTATGNESQVSTVVSSTMQWTPQVTGLADGGYVVVWSRGSAAAAQRYDAMGAKMGSEFQLNTTATATAAEPSVTALPDGGFTVTWTDTSGAILTRTYSDGSTVAGDDAANVLTGSSNSQSLFGAGGDDTLDGGAGNDLLNGGTDNDTLVGGAGADRYQFGRGMGQDLVQSHDTDGGADVLALANSVASDQLWFSRDGDDLLVSIVGTNDKATIQDWYEGADYKLDRVQLANGQYADASDVEQLVTAMAIFTPPAVGQLNLDNTTKQALAPVLAASWQS